MKPEDFPEGELRERFSGLMQNLGGFQSDEGTIISADEAEKLAEEILSIFTDLAYRDPNYCYHLSSDIDLISHFAATQPTTPEKPNPNYNLSKLTYEKLQQLRKLSEKAKSSVTAHADDKDAVKKTSKLAMTLPKWLVLIGGVLLMIGILMAFLSSNYNSELMGEAQKGFAVFAPEPSSAEWQEKERLLWWVNFWFYFGLVLTAIGVALQTVGSILPLKNY